MSTIRGRTILAWSKHVIAQDNYTCQFCSSQKNLVAHHVHPKETFPELLLVMENGLTLCKSCHSQYHTPKGTVPPLATLEKAHAVCRGKKLTEDHKRKINPLGRKHTEETKLKIAESNKGKHGQGHPHTEESKRKIAEAHRGMKRSPESRARMSKAQKGRTHTAEHNAKIALAGFGRKHSTETLKKMSQAQKGHIVTEATRVKLRVANLGKVRVK